MIDLSLADHLRLVNDIASRAGTAAEIAKWYGVTTGDLKAFVEAHRGEIEDVAAGLEDSKSGDLTNSEPSPKELDELWVTKKTARLNRYQEIAEILYDDIKSGKLSGTELATAVREFRSYMTTVANELGQLLHRGSGDAGTGDTLSVDIQGIDMETLR